VVTIQGLVHEDSARESAIATSAPGEIGPKRGQVYFLAKFEREIGGSVAYVLLG